MEAIIFIGIQATGKSTFYKERFFNTHMRLSMDMLHTRNKEEHFLNTFFEFHQKFVIDNTNPLKSDRLKYIELAKANKYEIIGYFFNSNIDEALERNSQRQGKENISEVGIKSTYHKLEIPTYDEGYDELFYVEIIDNEFVVKKL